MKLKIYIVTFDGEKHLNHNLNSLFNSQYFKKGPRVETQGVLTIHMRKTI